MGNRRLEEFERDLIANVGDKAVRDIVNDFKSYNPSPSQGAAAKVTVTGAGTVKDADIGPKYRPLNTSGWQEAPKVDDWQRTAGINHVDAMCSAQDAVDKAERIKALAEAARHLKALAEAEAELNPEPKGSEK
jgi:hypothetical protein